MNPNQPNGLPPLPQNLEPVTSSPLMQPSSESASAPVVQVTEPAETKKEWNSTPWILGIFVMLVLIAILTIVAINVYSKPVKTNVGSSSTASSISQSASSSDNAYGLSITKSSFDTVKGEWSYEVSGYLPTPCHTAKADVVILESMPEQVLVNVTFTAPAADTMCIQVLKEFTLTGKFTASAQAIIKLGSVK